MRSISALCLGAQFALLVSVSVSQESDEPLPLRLIAYNVHLLPVPDLPNVVTKRSEPVYRAREIGRLMAEYDIIGLCEAFHKDHRNELFNSIQHFSEEAFQQQPQVSPQPPTGFLVHGGLMLLSRFPVVGSHDLVYQHHSSPGRDGDGLAAKGVLHARLSLGKQDGNKLFLDCFLTHMESSSDKERDGQIDELSAFIAAHADPKNPLFVMGDMNVKAPAQADTVTATQYGRLLAAIQNACGQPMIDVGGGLGGTSDPCSPSGGNRIDYVFASEMPARSSVLPFRDQLVPEGTLSDHSAVSCEMGGRLAQLAAEYTRENRQKEQNTKKHFIRLAVDITCNRQTDIVQAEGDLKTLLNTLGQKETELYRHQDEVYFLVNGRRVPQQGHWSFYHKGPLKSIQNLLLAEERVTDGQGVAIEITVMENDEGEQTQEVAKQVLALIQGNSSNVDNVLKAMREAAEKLRSIGIKVTVPGTFDQLIAEVVGGGTDDLIGQMQLAVRKTNSGSELVVVPRADAEELHRGNAADHNVKSFRLRGCGADYEISLRAK